MLDAVVDYKKLDSSPVEHGASTAASVLQATLGVLEDSHIPYVVLHGYENFPDISGSDVDICIDRTVSDQSMRKLLQDNADVIGAQVVKCRNGAILLASRNSQHRCVFLKLDLDHDYALNGLRLVAGEEILAARQRHGNFHIPAPTHQLAGYLAASIIKAKLDAPRTMRLNRLYQSDPTGSAKQIARLFPTAEQTLILQALADNRWDLVIAALPQLRNDLIARLHRRNLYGRVSHAVQKFVDRVRRIIRPTGLSVVMLGPDGAGKSSITDAVGGPDLLPIFDRSVCWGFVPPLHRLIGRNHGPSNQPHALAPRSRAGSIVKAAYWLAFSLISHPRTFLMKARGGLVLYDRHFVDILIDAARYRYNGPLWILRVIWLVIPKPDLVVLLDAPAEIIQKRKQELSVAETARQLNDYRTLVGALPNGVILDANKSFPEVVEALNRLLLARFLKRDATTS